MKKLTIIEYFILLKYIKYTGNIFDKVLVVSNHNYFKEYV